MILSQPNYLYTVYGPKYAHSFVVLHVIQVIYPYSWIKKMCHWSGANTDTTEAILKVMYKIVQYQTTT